MLPRWLLPRPPPGGIARTCPSDLHTVSLFSFITVGTKHRSGAVGSVGRRMVGWGGEGCDGGGVIPAEERGGGGGWRLRSEN